MLRFSHIIPLLILAVSSLNAQEKPDTSAVISTFTIDPNTLLPQEKTLDTSYLPVKEYNPVFYRSFSSTFLGNAGLPAQTNFFNDRNYNSDFLFGIPYEAYVYTPFNTPHFNTRKPFTMLKYLTSGSRENNEQVLKAIHTQNVNPNANIGIIYDLIASRGIYLNQNTGYNRLNLFGSYNKNDYSFYISAHLNNLRAQENGGIENISEFVNKQASELNYSVLLNNADSRSKNLNAFFTHGLKLSALTKDSAAADKLEKFLIQHRFNYDRKVRAYRHDLGSADSLPLYQNYYYRINEAYDSAFYHNLSNRFDISFKLAKESQELRLFAEHEFKSFQYLQPVNVSYDLDSVIIDTVIADNAGNKYNDISVGGQFLGNLQNWEYLARGRFYLTGYRQTDLILDGEFSRYFTNRTRKLTLGASLSSVKPSYFLMNYGASNFIWNNDFLNIDNTSFRFAYSGQEDFTLKAFLNYYTGFVYFNEEAIPSQFTSEFFALTIYLDKTFHWGDFHHRHEILLQESSGTLISLPNLAYGNSVWYENSFFKNALKFNIGFDLYYFTPYFADAYMPATGLFHKQNNREAGNYPFLDLYLNFNIKRTHFSLQYTNALADFLDANYFMAYRYPTFGSSLKFGLLWTFYD